MEKLKAPGLGYRKRRSGPDVPYWVADARAVKAGYPVKAVNLSIFANEPALLRQRCERLRLRCCCGFPASASKGDFRWHVQNADRPLPHRS